MDRVIDRYTINNIDIYKKAQPTSYRHVLFGYIAYLEKILGTFTSGSKSSS